MVSFQQPFARSVVNSDIPGGLDVFIQNRKATIQSQTFDNGFVFELDGDTRPPAVEPGEELTVTVRVENRGRVSGDNPDSCGSAGGIDGGTSVALAVSTAADGKVRQSVCVPDAATLGGQTETVAVPITAPSEPGTVDTIRIWLEAGNTFVRLTPIYGVRIQTIDTDSGQESDFADSEQPDSDPTPPEFEFNLDNVSHSCSISDTNVEEGQPAEVDVNLEGFVPPGEDSRKVTISLTVDGDVVAEGVGFVTVNGATGESFTLNLPGREEPYEIGYTLSDVRVA